MWLTRNRSRVSRFAWLSKSAINGLQRISVRLTPLDLGYEMAIEFPTILEIKPDTAGNTDHVYP